MNTEYFFLEREVSWLSFNERVLQEAADKNNPLIERMRFLGIYSNNLDEFHKVRFANIKRQIFLDEQQGKEPRSKQSLKRIKSKILKATLLFYRHYNALLLEMARDQIFLVNEKQLTPDQGKWIEKYFYHELRKYTCPIMLSEHTSLLKVLKEDYTYLVVEIIDDNNVQYALVEVPSDKVSRFIVLPSDNAKKHKSIILLDNIYRYCLPNIFKGFFKFNQLHAYSMKMTRDAEYDVVQEMETSLIDIMSTGLKQRLTAKAVQFVYQKEMPNNLVALLIKQLNISSYDSIIAGERYHNFKDFMTFPALGKNNLIYKTLTPLKYNRFKQYQNGFEAIKAQDVLLYYPYYAFEHILELLRQASFDPMVTEIEINIYRVAPDSRIINSMINAAKNGKKVTVVVELQARFDEAANIKWAQKLTESGAKVIFSPTGLKIHAKLFIISRIEQNKIVQYAHVGTGNFNERTATLYTDFALLTANEQITRDIKRVFDFIENPYRPVSFDQLLISPQNTREKLYHLINRQIQYAQQGEKSSILIKINNLEDEAIIEKLYAASQAGVTIRLIVRGVCTLIPNVPGMSDNIHIISIVDRFLEHARVYVFYYGNEQEVYLSSADWMTRNLDYRIEAGVKIEDTLAKKTVLDIVELQWKDDVKARVVDKDLNNKYVEKKNNKRVRSQIAIYDYLKNLEQRQLEASRHE